MREPQLIITTGTKGLVQQYLTPNILTGKKPRKVLIFDVNGELQIEKEQELSRGNDEKMKQ